VVDRTQRGEKGEKQGASGLEAPLMMLNIFAQLSYLQ
jgi:hypothetical protein